MELAAQDVAFGAAWLATNALVLRACLRTSRLWFPGEEGASRVLQVAVLYVSLVTVALTLVGAAGLLGRLMVLVVSATVALLLSLVRWQPGRSLLAKETPPVGVRFLWILLGGILAGHVIYSGLLRWPSDWDTLMYHLPFINHWLQSGSLAFNGEPMVFEMTLDAVQRMCGPVHFFCLAALPTIAGVLLVRALLSIRSYDSLATLAVLFAFFGSGCVWLVTPMLVEDQPGTLNHLRWGYTPVRYGLCFLSLAVMVTFAGFAAFTNRCSIVWQRIVIGAVGIMIGYQMLHTYWEFRKFEIATGVLLGGLIGSTMFVIDWIASARWVRVSLASVFVVLSLMGIGYLSSRWHAGLSEHFNQYHATTVFTVLDELPGERILVLDERSYPYFGSRRQHYVQQPMLYYGMDDVRQRLEQSRLGLVVTVVEQSKIISRYRPAWYGLNAEPERFERINPGDSSSVQIYRWHGDP